MRKKNEPPFISFRLAVLEVASVCEKQETHACWSSKFNNDYSTMISLTRKF